jgi:hypothetical protein
MPHVARVALAASYSIELAGSISTNTGRVSFDENQAVDPFSTSKPRGIGPSIRQQGNVPRPTPMRRAVLAEVRDYASSPCILFIDRITCDFGITEEMNAMRALSLPATDTLLPRNMTR